ncbi:helix-turn-helix domain-containing protein [Streptomyces sp. NPDC056401]|uniref:helix-turn-helix domain-containing protein n=1 Tax=Streptomyces sp. NPDC056401 TaxID=3345809 RepID=UPI0035DF7888
MARTDLLWTTAEAAEAAGVSAKTLVNWRSLKRGPKYLKPGGPRGPVRYRPADVRAWLRTREFDPEAPAPKKRARRS